MMTTTVLVALIITNIATGITCWWFGQMKETGHLKREIGRLLTANEALWRQIRRKPR